MNILLNTSIHLCNVGWVFFGLTIKSLLLPLFWTIAIKVPSFLSFKTSHTLIWQIDILQPLIITLFLPCAKMCPSCLIIIQSYYFDCTINKPFTLSSCFICTFRPLFISSRHTTCTKDHRLFYLNFPQITMRLENQITWQKPSVIFNYLCHVCDFVLECPVLTLWSHRSFECLLLLLLKCSDKV